MRRQKHSLVCTSMASTMDMNSFSCCTAVYMAQEQRSALVHFQEREDWMVPYHGRHTRDHGSPAVQTAGIGVFLSCRVIRSASCLIGEADRAAASSVTLSWEAKAFRSNCLVFARSIICCR